MAPLTFADKHNMVAFLSKSDASDGFDQIVDFLNAHTITYALMVNPTFYVSCIKHFGATTTVEKVNGDVQLQALIDDKKLVVTEAIIRRDLHLDDADRVECLPNAETFKELARMGYEKPPLKLTFYKAFFSAQWNSMAFAVICLATGKKLNYSKYIFDSMVRNVDSPSKFLMYPRFIQVLLDHQVEDMTTHTTRYKSPVLTQKVFANIRRVGNGFSCVETHMFDSMLLQSQQQADVGVKVLITHAQPSTTSAPAPTELHDTTPTPHEKDRNSQALEILQLKKRVKRLERKKKFTTLGLKRLRRVGADQRVESSSNTVLGAEEDASKQGEGNSSY
nr:hypothetical protein [Tanacetum cinerariifolium]